MIESIHIRELQNVCRAFGFEYNSYVKSFKRKYPEIMIIGDTSGRVQEDKEQQ